MTNLVMQWVKFTKTGEGEEEGEEEGEGEEKKKEKEKCAAHHHVMMETDI